MSDASEMKMGVESVKGFGGKIVQAILGFAGTILFARMLGPSTFGGFYFLLSIVNLTDRPIRGVTAAARKRYSEDGSPKDEIIGASLFVIATISTIIAIVVFILRDRLVEATNITNAPVVFVLLLLFIILFIFGQSIVGATGQVSKQIWLDTVRSLLTFPLQLLFILSGFSAAGMGYGLAGASLIAFGASAYFIEVRPSIPSTETLRSLWAYAKYSIPGTLVGKAYAEFDILLLGFVLSTAEVGQYEVAYKLTIPATFVYSVICTGLMPKVSSLSSKDEDVTMDVTNALSYASLLAVPLFFGALAISKYIVVTIYGPEYSAAATALIGLTLYRLVASQTEVYQSTLDGLDYPDVGMKIDTATLAVNIAFGLALVYEFGIIGVVAATVVAETFRYLLSARAISVRADEVPFIPRPLRDQVVAGIVMFVLVRISSEAIPVRSWVELGVLVGIGALTYGAVLFGISEGHRQTLRSIASDFTTS